MAENIINNIKDFYNFIVSNKKISALFNKKDGTKRLIHATLDFDMIPSSKHPKKQDQKKIREDLKKGLIHVYDLDKEGWRTINYNETYWIENEEEPNMRYRIRK